MIRLLRAEVVRLLSRRFTVIALLAVLAAVGAFQLVVNSELRPPSAAELTAAQTQLEKSRQDWQQNHTEYETDCRGSAPSGTDCTIPEPTLADYVYRPTFREVANMSLSLAVYLSALAVFMVAGSSIGAEFSSGSISNWLTFIPQRGRVFAAKLLVIAGFGALLTLASSALALGVVVALAKSYGQHLETLGALTAMGARGVLIGVALAVLGFCIGLVGRHTSAAIGVLLGYLFVWFVRNALLSETTWAQRLTPITPEGNLGAILEKGHRYVIPTRHVGADGVQIDYLEHTISLAHGLTYWALILAVVVVASLLVFRRRDVS